MFIHKMHAKYLRELLLLEVTNSEELLNLYSLISHHYFAV